MCAASALRLPSFSWRAPGPTPGRPNLWPDAELPELRPAFQALGRLVVETGLLLARRCDAYAAGRAGGVLPCVHALLCILESEGVCGRPRYPVLRRAAAAGAVEGMSSRLACRGLSDAARRVRRRPPRRVSNRCTCVRVGATIGVAARQAAPPCAGPGAAARPGLGLHDALARSPCHKGRLLHYYPLPPALAAAPGCGARGGGGGAGGADGVRTCAGDGEGALGREASGEAGAGGEAGALDAAADDWCGWHRDHGSLTGAAPRRARGPLPQRCRGMSHAVTQERRA